LLGLAVGPELRSALGSELDLALGSSLRLLGSALGSALGSSLSLSRLGSALGSELGSALGSALGSELGSSVQSTPLRPSSHPVDKTMAGSNAKTSAHLRIRMVYEVRRSFISEWLKATQYGETKEFISQRTEPPEQV
jgi:phage tail tape-measure protein